MTQEIATQTTPHGGEVQAKTLMQKGVEKLRQHAELKAMATEYAGFITQTGACPAIYKNKPNDAAAAIIRGTALGFDPDGALEAFFVINGKTGMYARAMIAVAEMAGCRVWEVEASDDKVTWAGTRPGSNKVEQSTWTMTRAQTAGYTKNNRYKSNGTEMLRSKCQAELARMLAPGPLMGLYSENEPTAFEPAPLQATAARTDVRQERGADAVRAALAQKQQPEQSTAPQPDPKALEDIHTAESVDQLGDIMNGLQGVDPAVWAEYTKAADQRAAILNGAQ